MKGAGSLAFTRSLALAAGLALIAGAANAVDDGAARVPLPQAPLPQAPLPQAPSPQAPSQCAVPPALEAIGQPLARSAARIEQGAPLRIIAIGSSSTSGAGASTPAFNYPSRLAVELRKRFPRIAIEVLNRGRGGEEAPQMLARLGRDVAPFHPDLVIWQLGTNAVLRHTDMTAERDPIERGLAELKATGADIVLMDVQYAPRVLAHPQYAAMEAIIADEAARAHVGLFGRFAIMRQWSAQHDQRLPATVGPDGLHMNDAGYGCLAADLAQALADNWQSQLGLPAGTPAASAAPPRHTALATSPHRH
jgi:lysophospholipase L1-like esterase